jgi:uncharacterized protein (DUF305 family)
MNRKGRALRHNEQATKESSKCLKSGYHDELKDLCQQIIDAQQQKMAQMQTWHASNTCGASNTSRHKLPDPRVTCRRINFDERSE